MLISFFANSLISLVILGYSYLFKILILREKNSLITNLDFIYGIFFLIFISFFLNFFLAVVTIKLVLFAIGIIFFLLSLYNKKISINYIGLFFLGLIPTDLTLSSFSLLAFNEIPNGEFKINLTSIIVIINHT